MQDIIRQLEEKREQARLGGGQQQRGQQQAEGHTEGRLHVFVFTGSCKMEGRQRPWLEWSYLGFYLSSKNR